MIKPAVIFDLDGTLVDTAPGIFAGLQAALDFVGVVPVRPVDCVQIGPPLREMLTGLLGPADISKIELISLAFVKHYDDCSCLMSREFANVGHMLDELLRAGSQIFLATNKREVPTRKILDYLGWTSYFQEIYSIDGRGGPFRDKSQMLSHILTENNLLGSGAIYIGDRDEDGIAAFRDNGISFLLATWGSGYNQAIVTSEDWRRLPQPEATVILRLFDELQLCGRCP